METLCARKADREGHMADVVADSLFHTIMAVRFRRRGEGQKKGACDTIERLLRSTGQMSLASLIGTHGWQRIRP